jgi:hypothetical protein
MRPLPLPRREPAPPFDLKDSRGDRASLKDYRFRHDLLLIRLHGPGCAACRVIAEEIRSHRRDWEKWETRLLVVQSETDALLDVPGRIAFDPEGSLPRDYRAGEGEDLLAAVLDHRGRFMEGWSLAHPDSIDWREASETVRWVAIQEPECGACEVLPGWAEE